MKVKRRAAFWAVVLLLSFALVFSACGGKTYVKMEIDISGVGALSQGDLFDPNTLTVRLVTERGATRVLDLEEAEVTVDDTVYTGTAIAVHSPSCTVKITYAKGEGQEPLSAEVTLDVAAGSAPAADARKVKVIVMAGQSNMVGHSLVDRFSAGQKTKYQAGFPNVLILNSCNPYRTDVQPTLTDCFVPVKAGMGRIPNDPAKYPNGCFGPELGLAEYLSKTYPDETFYIIKDATDGSTLYKQWYSPSSYGYLGVEKAAGNNLYEHLLSRVDEGMAMLRGQDLEAEIVALLWMQGESDTRGHIGDYDTLWRNFVSDLTAEWQKKAYLPENGLSTIDAGVTEYWADHAVLNAIKELWAAEHSKGYYVDVPGAGLTRKAGDPAHLDYTSMLELGRLFGEKLSLAMADLENAATETKVAPKGNGTAESPLLIGSYEEWLYFARAAFTDSFDGKYIRLTADIGSAEKPVRVTPGVSSALAFAGVLDGDGHTVYVKILGQQQTGTGRAVGLIAYSAGATVENLTVAGEIRITAGGFGAGGIIGQAEWADGKTTTLRSCVNEAAVTVAGDSVAGGLVGKAVGNLSVTGSANHGAVSTITRYAGGVVGCVERSAAGGAPSLTVSDTVNTGHIKAMKGVGGLVGAFQAGVSSGTHRLLNVSNTGAIEGTAQFGGIIGCVAAESFEITVTYREANCQKNGEDAVIGLNDSLGEGVTVAKITG